MRGEPSPAEGVKPMIKVKLPTQDDFLDIIARQILSTWDGCPKCARPTVFYRVKKRISYSCKKCGAHISPLAGTIFEKSTTPIIKWLYAAELLNEGHTCLELQRRLGVTYKCAWRMAKQLREGGYVIARPHVTGKYKRAGIPETELREIWAQKVRDKNK